MAEKDLNLEKKGGHHGPHGEDSGPHKKGPHHDGHHGGHHGRHYSPAFNNFMETFRRVFISPSAKLGGVMFLIVVLLLVFAPIIAPYKPTAVDLKNTFATPSLAHLCGTDKLGRDIFSRLLYGGRYSLALGLTAAIVGSVGGVIVGSIAGYFGGKVEDLIMRFCDIWGALPGSLMTLLLAASFGAGLWQTIVSLSISAIPNGARMTRGQILGERGKEYVEAAESFNCPKRVIMFRHLLPNVISPTIVNTTMKIGGSITMVAGLSYLGLGIQPPTPEWGAMLSDGISYISAYPHMVIFPGIAIAICVLSINLMGDGLRDALDPKMRS
ncbi:MAG: ABC transporter permease [Clostridiales bacterium]|nr:ABC transporter permease [Clostridiales bacterium]